MEKKILMLGKFDAGKTTFWTTAVDQINKGLVGKRLWFADQNDRIEQKVNVKKIKSGTSVGNTRLVNEKELIIQHKKGLIGSWQSNPEWPVFIVSDTPGGATEEAFLSNIASADITENLTTFNELFKSYSVGEVENTPSAVILVFSCADFLGTLNNPEKLEQMTDQLNTLVDTISFLEEEHGIVAHIVFSMHDRVHDNIKNKIADIIVSRGKNTPFAFANATDVKGAADDWGCGKTLAYVIRKILEIDGMPPLI